MNEWVISHIISVPSNISSLPNNVSPFDMVRIFFLVSCMNRGEGLIYALLGCFCRREIGSFNDTLSRHIFEALCNRNGLQNAEFSYINPFRVD